MIGKRKGQKKGEEPGIGQRIRAEKEGRSRGQCKIREMIGKRKGRKKDEEPGIRQRKKERS
jgi:hypothetical protein